MGTHDQDDWGVQEQAAQWCHRLKGPDAERVRDAFQYWYRRSRLHRREFFLASLVDTQLSALRRHAPDLQGPCGETKDSKAGVIPFRRQARNNRLALKVRARPHEAPTNLRVRRIASLAFAAAVSMLVLGVLWNYGVLAGRADYATAIGHQRTVYLEDGTVVELNTHSRIAVSFTRERRTLELIEGEAWFDVGRDSRPLHVRAGAAIVEHVGTRFVMRREAGSLDVVVESGKVNVAIAPRIRSGIAVKRPMAELTARQAVTLSIDTDAPVPRVRAISSDELSRRLAWRDGHLAFGGETLAEIVAQFNRYNVRQLQIADPRVAGVRLGGRFRADELETFVEALPAVGVRAEATAEGPIRLVAIRP
jgi:transmembrane sensor